MNQRVKKVKCIPERIASCSKPLMHIVRSDRWLLATVPKLARTVGSDPSKIIEIMLQLRFDVANEEGKISS